MISAARWCPAAERPCRASLIKDDSTTGSGGNVTIANVQSYTGMTYVEAGTLTLGAVNAIESSAGVILGRSAAL